MGCCNRRREALASDQPTHTQRPRAVGTESGRAGIRYLGGAMVTVRGPATGLAYVFSRRQPTRNIDRRDLAALLRSKLFAKA